MGSEGSKPNPEILEDLLAHTFLEEDEIMSWYKQFLVDHPTGFLVADEFENVYSKAFPNGDASTFAQQVFRTFDRNGDGMMDFKEFVCALNITRRGTVKQKLKWAFDLYDIDSDGFITKKEMCMIAKAIEKMGIAGNNHSKKRIKEAFENMDKNSDGKLTFNEFLAAANDFPEVVNMLEVTAPSEA